MIAIQDCSHEGEHLKIQVSEWPCFVWLWGALLHGGTDTGPAVQQEYTLQRYYTAADIALGPDAP